MSLTPHRAFLSTMLIGGCGSGRLVTTSGTTTGALVQRANDGAAIFKNMIQLKRKPGLSMAEFIVPHEIGHAQPGVKYQTKMKRYIRRHLHRGGERLGGEVIEPEYGVATELWFDDRQAFEEGMALLQAPEVLAELTADEETLFDRSKNRLVMVEDRESVLPWVKP